jgi:hypothetical protein
MRRLFSPTTAFLRAVIFRTCVMIVGACCSHFFGISRLFD